MDKTEINAALHILTAVADAIRDLREVPAGHLYASVCGHMSHSTFEKIIGTLVGASVVTRDGSHVLRWIG